MAIDMYKKLDYVVYRTVIDYYAGSEVDEDAYGKWHARLTQNNYS